jgi:hypothetical protein
VPRARVDRARALEKLAELDLPAEEFVKVRRRRARQSYELVRPQIEATATQLISLLTEVYGKQAVNMLRLLRDPDKSSWEWLTDVVAISIEDWTRPLEFLMRLVSSTAVPALKPSKHLRFDIDQASQASDPQPIEVNDPKVRRKIAKGKLTLQGLNSRTQSIPAENVRLSVKGDKVFVSLVDLAKLGRLNPTEFSGTLRAEEKGNPRKVSPKGSAAPRAVVLGTAHTKISEGPG